MRAKPDIIFGFLSGLPRSAAWREWCAARCDSLQDLILECHAFGVIFLEPSVRSFFVRKNFEMAGVANMVSGVDVNPNGRHWSLLSFRFPQCISLRSVNVRSMLRFKARSTPMRECIMKSRPSAAPIRQPMSVCHSARFWLGFPHEQVSCCRLVFLVRAAHHDLQRVISQLPLQRFRLIPRRAHPHVAAPRRWSRSPASPSDGSARPPRSAWSSGSHRRCEAQGSVSIWCRDSPLNSVQIPAKANSGRSSFKANQTTSFLVSGFGSGAYSAKLLAGTRHRLPGFSQPRQCDDDVLRILVTGGPPLRGGVGIPQRIVVSSR